VGWKGLLMPHADYYMAGVVSFNISRLVHTVRISVPICTANIEETYLYEDSQPMMMVERTPEVVRKLY
jgi:hypothetical protein